MNVFSDTVAAAWPTSPQEIEGSVRALTDVRNSKLPVEVRIGVGPLRTDVPLRVLGYAGCAAEAIRTDVRMLVQPATPRIELFSSAPKAGRTDGGRAIIALVALAGALRLAGIDNAIGIDIAANDPEIPANLDVALEPHLAEWVMSRDMRHRPGETPSFRYAFEHASPTMFGDIADGDDPPFRVTVGGATEARFWAVRMHVRAAAAVQGARLAPVAGIIIKALRVPWYQPIPSEPSLAAAHRPEEATRALAEAANPTRGGNAALKREVRAASRLAHGDGVTELIDAVNSPGAATRFALENGFNLGPRITQKMGVGQ